MKWKLTIFAILCLHCFASVVAFRFYKQPVNMMRDIESNSDKRLVGDTASINGDSSLPPTSAFRDANQKLGKPPRSMLTGGLLKYKEYVELAGYFGLWYFLTVLYNVTNKKVLNVFAFPSLVAFIQLALGIPMILPVWVLKPPRINKQNFQSYFKISLCHALGNLATVYSLGAGSVSFTHIVKAAEPVFSALLSTTILGTVYSASTYVTLFIIMFGVAMASLREVSFSALAFSTAMASNLLYQLRNVVSKQELNESKTEAKVSPAQLYRVITVFAALQLLPVALLVESRGVYEVARTSVWTKETNTFLLNLVISGLSFYTYNEVAFRILDKISPVTHAVGNAVKRVVLVVASIVFLHSPITVQGGIGAAVAIVGTLLYGLLQNQGGSAARSRVSGRPSNSAGAATNSSKILI